MVLAVDKNVAEFKKFKTIFVSKITKQLGIDAQPKKSTTNGRIIDPETLKPGNAFWYWTDLKYSVVVGGLKLVLIFMSDNKRRDKQNIQQKNMVI